MRIFSIIVLTLAAVAALGCVHYYWPRPLYLPMPGIAQSITTSADGVRVTVADRVLIGEMAEFDDGLFAFLMFDYLRGRPSLAGNAIMLTSSEEHERPIYRILVRLPDDLVSGVDFLAQLKADRLASSVHIQLDSPLETEFLSARNVGLLPGIQRASCRTPQDPACFRAGRLPAAVYSLQIGNRPQNFGGIGTNTFAIDPDGCKPPGGRHHRRRSFLRSAY